MSGQEFSFILFTRQLEDLEKVMSSLCLSFPICEVQVAGPQPHGVV